MTVYFTSCCVGVVESFIVVVLGLDWLITNVPVSIENFKLAVVVLIFIHDLCQCVYICSH